MGGPLGGGLHHVQSGALLWPAIDLDCASRSFTPHPTPPFVRADPLRVLRAVRFATRFGFDLHPEILEAASSDNVGRRGRL